MLGYVSLWLIFEIFCSFNQNGEKKQTNKNNQKERYYGSRDKIPDSNPFNFHIISFLTVQVYTANQSEQYWRSQQSNYVPTPVFFWNSNLLQEQRPEKGYNTPFFI